MSFGFETSFKTNTQFGFESRGGEDTFHPLDLAGSQLYFAKNTATPSLWNDQSPNGYDLTQATATQQPTISANSVDFDGVNDVLFRNIANPFGSDTQGILFFSCYYDGVNQCYIIASGDTGSNNYSIVFRINLTGNLNLILNNAISGTYNLTTSDTPIVGYNYGYFRNDGVSTYFSLNGGAESIPLGDAGEWLDYVPSRNNLSFGALIRASTVHVPSKLNKIYYNNNGSLSASYLTKLDTFFANPFNFDGILPATEPKGIFGASLYDWWDFTDNTTLALSGSRIDAIDSKASGRQLSSTGANRPQIVSNQVNGLQVANFDGVSEFMEVPSSTSLYNFLHDQSNGGMLIIVSRVTNANPNVVYTLATNSSNQSANIGFDLRYDDRSSSSRNNNLVSLISRGVIGVANVTALQDFNNIYETQKFNVIAQICDPNNGTAIERLNTIVNFGSDNKANIYTNAPSTSNATNNFTIGYRPLYTDFYFKGDISEIIITTGQPTALQLTQVQTYLTNKYGTFPIS